MLTVPATRTNCLAIKRYEEQNGSAKRRGINLEMSLAEWQWVWLSSGHWEDRGPKLHQYCMARHGDTGPYKVGNVSIKTNHENMLEIRVSDEKRQFLSKLYTGTKKSEQTRQRMSEASRNRKAGYCFPSRKKPVEVQCVRYDSVTAAAEALGVCQPTLSKRIKAGAEGYRWTT
jgi:hypothetical protein